MRTFLEYNENNNTDSQIEQLAYNIAELGINPLEILGKMSENIISKLDDKEDKIKVAFIEQEIIEGIGSAIGNMAGKIRNSFSDMGKGYQQTRNDYQNQNGQPAPDQQQGQQQQGQQQQQQMAQLIQSFKDSLVQAGYGDQVQNEIKALEDKLAQIQQAQQQPQAQAQQPQAQAQQPQAKQQGNYKSFSGRPQAQAPTGAGPGFSG